MPELPEVEFARRSLTRWFRGRRLVRAEAERSSRVFRGGDVRAFERLHGRLVDASRRGKYLLLTFEGGQGLVGHLGMTGKLVKRAPGEAVPWSRARFVLDSGEVVHFRDPRMFGRLEPVEAARLPEVKAVKALGVDPLVDGLTVGALQAALAGSRQALKVALMDQTRVAGLGNIHAAEALWRARLHPARTVASLTTAEWKRLVDAIRGTIAFALDVEEGEEIDYVEEPGAENPFLVYGHAGEPCRRCRAKVQAVVQAGRTTYFCPGCQEMGPARRGRATKRRKPVTPTAPRTPSGGGTRGTRGARGTRTTRTTRTTRKARR